MFWSPEWPNGVYTHQHALNRQAGIVIDVIDFLSVLAFFFYAIFFPYYSSPPLHGARNHREGNLLEPWRSATGEERH